MKKIALLAPVALFIACGSSSPGYLNTDVLEPQGLSKPVVQGAKYQGGILTEGTLTFEGPGDVHKTYIGYVDSMRKLMWEPRSSDGDPAKGMTAVLKKDTRELNLSITPEGQQGNIKVVIKVGAAK